MRKIDAKFHVDGDRIVSVTGRRGYPALRGSARKRQLHRLPQERRQAGAGRVSRVCQRAPGTNEAARDHARRARARRQERRRTLMLKRMWHFFVVGHGWKALSAAWNLPLARYSAPSLESEMRAAWGFTEIVVMCSCGAVRKIRPIGDHTSIKSNLELLELERLLRKPL